MVGELAVAMVAPDRPFVLGEKVAVFCSACLESIGDGEPATLTTTHGRAGSSHRLTHRRCTETTYVTFRRVGEIHE